MRRERTPAAAVNRAKPVQLTDAEFRALKAANLSADQARAASACASQVVRTIAHELQVKYGFDADGVWTLDEATCRLLPSASDSGASSPRG